MKDIYVMLARFLTQLKKLYKNIKTNRVSLIKKKRKKKIVSTVDKTNTFSFEPITAIDTSQQIKCLDINKATQENDIPTKLVNVLIIS